MCCNILCVLWTSMEDLDNMGFRRVCIVMMCLDKELIKENCRGNGCPGTCICLGGWILKVKGELPLFLNFKKWVGFLLTFWKLASSLSLEDVVKLTSFSVSCGSQLAQTPWCKEKMVPWLFVGSLHVCSTADFSVDGSSFTCRLFTVLAVCFCKNGVFQIPQCSCSLAWWYRVPGGKTGQYLDFQRHKTKYGTWCWKVDAYQSQMFYLMLQVFPAAWLSVVVYVLTLTAEYFHCVFCKLLNKLSDFWFSCLNNDTSTLVFSQQRQCTLCMTNVPHFI